LRIGFPIWKISGGAWGRDKGEMIGSGVNETKRQRQEAVMRMRQRELMIKKIKNRYGHALSSRKCRIFSISDKMWPAGCSLKALSRQFFSSRTLPGHP
jgi:hypothetical protein